MTIMPYPQPLELKGQAASSGIALGPLVVLKDEARERPHSGDEALEKRVLSEAIRAAVHDIAAISGTLAGEGADILEYQIAMLEDENLSSAAFALIASGKSASGSWREVVDAEIAGYSTGEDDYFRARASDLKDMRDRVLRKLSGETRKNSSPAGAILAGEDVAPTQFLQTDWSKGGGVVLSGGSSSSHVAMLARSRGVPMVVGLGDAAFSAHGEAIVDGEAGIVVLSPGTAERSRFALRKSELASRKALEDRHLPHAAVTADGIRIEVLINVAAVEELNSIDITHCDGIGLMRTEFLFRDGEPLPDEELQYRSYRRFLEWAGDKPVTIRTLDIGGDKPVRPLTPTKESNPFLGIRGVRLTLAHPEVFRIQLRALARAAIHGNLKIMIPMVTVPQELHDSEAILDEVVADLKRNGIGCKKPPLGMMVEVPAAALVPELFGNAAFFSIGSNDLTQYVTAASRDDPAVAALNDPGHPAILRLIKNVALFGAHKNLPVSLCGDMASDEHHIANLLKAGIRSLSVAPAALGRVKAEIASVLFEK